MLQMPAGILLLGGNLISLVNPRMGQLLDFAAKASIVDCVAPIAGSRRLEDYFKQLAGFPAGERM